MPPPIFFACMQVQAQTRGRYIFRKVNDSLQVSCLHLITSQLGVLPQEEPGQSCVEQTPSRIVQEEQIQSVDDINTSV